jgi:hypothetical protein
VQETNLVQIKSFDRFINIQKVLISCFETHSEINLFSLSNYELNEPND